MRYSTLGSGAPRLTNLLGVCQGVWHGDRASSGLLLAMHNSHTGWNVGIAISVPSSPLSGDKCPRSDTKTRSIICTFRNVISLQVRCWDSYGDSLASKQSLTGGLLGAGVGASLLGRVFCEILSSYMVFPCVLVQVPLHQPGGTLVDPGLCHIVWAGPLLHLQRLWPVDEQPGVGTWPGRAPRFGEGGGRVSFLCSHNNQTQAVQESWGWK